MSRKTIVIISVVVNLILLSLVIYYKEEDKRYISKVKNDNISMLKIVGEDTEVIKQVPQSGQWSMSYTCDDENAELYWNEKKRTVVAKNISETECTLIFRESDAIFRMISMYVDGEYVTELNNTKKYEMESYECTNEEELIWDIKTNKLSIEPILSNTSCYVNFNEILPTLTEKMLLAEEAKNSDGVINYTYTSEGCSSWDTENNVCSSYDETQVTNGLYKTSINTEGGEEVYFYRGIVDNNYVVFGDYCWRIVRTNEDGSVKLRYGGKTIKYGNAYTCPNTGTHGYISASEYHSVADDKLYVNYKTSNIKTVIESWYEDNIAPNTSLTNLIEDIQYCNDLSEYTLTNITFGATMRIGSAKAIFTPQFKCTDLNYAYTVEKGELIYPVALLTADEASYAGGVHNIPNASFYLYAKNIAYWLMSPSSFHNSADKKGRSWTIRSSGSLNGAILSNAGMVLPVISLKEEATVKRGTGLYNDPYIIKTN